MIIDDDTDVLDIMQEALDYEGFEVITSPVADVCKTLIREHRVDMLLIDYLLTGVNSGEICHELKSCAEFAHLPVIIISASPRVLESLGSYNCDLFIPKPFDLGDLVQKISLLLNCSTQYFL